MIVRPFFLFHFSEFLHTPAYTKNLIYFNFLQNFRKSRSFSYHSLIITNYYFFLYRLRYIAVYLYRKRHKQIKTTSNYETKLLSIQRNFFTR